jgi:hypothetical protein
LNNARKEALDKFHDMRARERYVAVLFQAEREFKQIFGKEGNFMHPQDRAREEAKEKARIHGIRVRSRGGGRFDRDPPMSLGLLEAEIKTVRAEWQEKWIKGESPEKVALREQILKETEVFVQDIKTKIANGDPEWTLTDEDYKLLGLDDSKPYGRYQHPVEKSSSMKSAEKAAPLRHRTSMPR